MAEAHVRAALSQIDVARAALRFARPDRGRDAAFRALGRAEAAIRAHLEDDPHDSLSEWDGLEERWIAMHRRFLLQATAALGATAAAPLEALDRLTAALARGVSRVDAPLVNAYADVTITYARAYYRVAPSALDAPVRDLLNRLTGLRSASAPADVRRRLDSATADAAVFAGWLSYDLGRPADARGQFALAQEAARGAGDASIHAIAVASTGIITGAAATAGVEATADAAEALWMLRNAARQLPDDAPHRARAWINAQAGSRAAAAGRPGEFDHHFEQVDLALDALHSDEPRTGFLSEHGWFSVVGDEHYGDDYRGGGLAKLGRTEATDVLLATIGTTQEPRRRTNSFRSLASLHVSAQDYDAAADAMVAGVTAARAGGLAGYEELIHTLRAQAPADERAFADLDDALSESRS
jgi:hypothetical protein